MGMGFHTPGADWEELTEPDYVNRMLSVLVDGAGDLEMIFEVALPAAGATGFPLPAGTHFLIVPDDKHVFVRVNSGSADVYYPQFTGRTCVVASCGYAYNGDAGADHDAVLDADIEVGFDDATTRAGANPYEMRGYLITDPVGLDSGDTLQFAVLSLHVLKMYTGRTVRIYGLAYDTDQSGTLADWADLNGLTKTTAFVEITEPPMDLLQADITDIVTELQGVGGWATTSPIQLILIDQGAEDSGIDSRLIISRESRQTNVSLMLDDGTIPEPP